MLIYDDFDVFQISNSQLQVIFPKISNFYLSFSKEIRALGQSALASHVPEISSPNCRFYSSYARYKNDTAHHPHTPLIG